METTDQATEQRKKTRAANIRAVWDALLAPRWTKDDLIDLGKAIYARRALKDLDAEKFNDLLPRLVEIVERLEAKFTTNAPAAPPPTPEETPRADDAAEPVPHPTGSADTLLPDVTSTRRG